MWSSRRVRRWGELGLTIIQSTSGFILNWWFWIRFLFRGIFLAGFYFFTEAVIIWTALAILFALGVTVTLPPSGEGLEAASFAGELCSADSLEIRTALHVVLTVIITVAGGISRIPFPTSPCTA